SLSSLPPHSTTLLPYTTLFRSYGYRRTAFAADARYNLSRSLTLGGGVERLATDRDRQAVASQTEDSGWALLEWRPNSLLEIRTRSEEHTSELQSRENLVCRLLP